MKFTIFTPTYNRAKLLPRLYQSLVVEQEIDFEWIVVDDGSTDETEEVVSEFIADCKIPIVYYKQENKGKHVAINRGVSFAKGDLFWIIDSDDRLAKEGMKYVWGKYQLVKANPKLGGVCGRGIFENGKVVGSSFGKDIITDSIRIRNQYGVTGDLVEVFKTDVMKAFPFPEIEGEKFCPEVLVWNRMAQQYQLLFFNEGIYVTEYQEDGLTTKIVKIRMNSPIASMLTYSELARYKIPLKKKIKANINFWRFSFSCKTYSFFKKLKMVSLGLAFFTFPLGFIMFINDQKQLKK
jgi:glycosyltransferase involved in cell wall biosynthesis